MDPSGNNTDPKTPKGSPQHHTDAVEAGQSSVEPTGAVSNPAGGNKSGIGTTQPKAVSSHMIPVRSHVPSGSVSFADMASDRAPAHGKPAAINIRQPPRVANQAPLSGSLPHDQCSLPPGHQQLTATLCVNVSSATPTAKTTTPTHGVTCVASSKAVVSVPDGTASGSSELTTSSVATPATVASIASTSAGDSESPSKATTPTQGVTPVASPSVVVPTPVNTRASTRPSSSALPASSASAQGMGASPGTNASVSTATTGPPPTTMATLVAPQQEPKVQSPIAASEVLPIGPATNPPRSSFQDLPSTSITHTSLNHMSIAEKPMPIPYNLPATAVSSPAPFFAVGQSSAGVARGAYTSTSAGEISHSEPSLCQASASSMSQPGNADESAFSARPPELQEAQATVRPQETLRDHLQIQLPQHYPQASYVAPFFVPFNSCWSANISGTHSDTNPPTPGFPGQGVAPAGSGATSVRQVFQNPWPIDYDFERGRRAEYIARQQEPEVQSPIALRQVLSISPASNTPFVSFQALPNTGISHASRTHASTRLSTLLNSSATSVSGPVLFGAICQPSAVGTHGVYTGTSAGDVYHPEPNMNQVSATSGSQPGNADESAFSARPPELQEAQATVRPQETLRDHLQIQLPQHHPQASYVAPFFVPFNSCWSANTSGTHSDTNLPVSRFPNPPGFPGQDVVPAGSGANSVRQVPQYPWLTDYRSEHGKSAEDIAPGQPKMTHSEQRRMRQHPRRRTRQQRKPYQRRRRQKRKQRRRRHRQQRRRQRRQ